MKTIAHSWGKASRESHRQFLEEITPGNLTRMAWVAGIYLPISIGGLVYNLIYTRLPEMTSWALFDIGLGIISLSLALVLRKTTGFLRTRLWVVRAYYAYCLVSMTGYYFSTLGTYPNNPVYVLGLLIPAMLFRLPPLDFLILLGATHAVYLAELWTSAGPEGVSAMALFLGTDSLVLAVIAAWTLFSKDWQSFLRSRALRRANEGLLKVTEDLNEVMLLAAHDIKGPLLNIRSLFRILGTKPEWRSEPYREVVAECDKALSNLVELVGDMLETHELEQGAKVPVFRPTRIGELLLAARDSLGASAAEKGSDIVIESSGTEELWPTDPVLCLRVVENLLSNAIKYSPPGSTVRIAWRREDGACRIDVRDAGPGIPGEAAPYLFQKFQRTGNLPTAGEPSNGLGLFIAARLAKLLNGTISCFPNDGGGSVFRLELRPTDEPEGVDFLSATGHDAGL
ncbi:signal transduction histidine kinase [Terrimicrobium sacchariphilum]|uniref:histidine kinase n=1 Tax=Terrimicrobium sacchariphilum TaxID=690879 RepID=A0A146GDP3_TERSA|nr:HAMP domain-containing sensor histidine kinase [Terrimicrobium sacchariphilum]GAT34638.1 signal transduction histidine kinase [Terrimicrobium sacchariphilum]